MAYICGLDNRHINWFAEAHKQQSYPMKVHFIAIGGNVMHALALSLHHGGHHVTGSDDIIYDPARTALEKAGLLPDSLGWNPLRIHAGLDAVILGMHAQTDNPELAAARALGIKILSFPELVYERSKNKERVVIAGSHGKTTITSMLIHVLSYHKQPFDYLVGSTPRGLDSAIRLTENAPTIIIEGDEYLSSPLDPRPKFLNYQPHIVVVNGIAWDHANVFPTVESYNEQFKNLVDAVPKAGSLIYNKEDSAAEKICAPAHKNRTDIIGLPYGVHSNRQKNGKTYLKTDENDVEVRFFGKHNLINVSAAKIVANRLGISDARFYEAISSFEGAPRRLEKLTETTQRIVFLDYAHAPSKLAATVQAVREQFPKSRLVALMELHTYSSLNLGFLPQYKNTLKGADEMGVYINPTNFEQKKIAPFAPGTLKNNFNSKDLKELHSIADIQDFLQPKGDKHTVYLLMSSGNFGGFSPQEWAKSIR